MAQFAVILLAAGGSRRFKDAHYKKPFAPLDNRAVWLHSAEKFLNRKDVKQLILVVAPEDDEEFRSKFAANVMILGIDVVHGGAERTDSVQKALAHVKPTCDFVAVHDAARPCLAEEWISSVFETGSRTGAAILGIPISSTLKRVRDDRTIGETVPRAGLWEAQTPQVFRRQLLLDAYAKRGTTPATDDAELVERLGQNVTVVQGSALNLKITTKEDLRLASLAIKALPKPKLAGPSHPFADDDMWR